MRTICLKTKYYFKSLVKKLYFSIYIKLINSLVDVKSTDKVLFVAHPDDELIFFSRELLNSNRWLVICMTNGDNVKRSREFVSVMKSIHTQFQIMNFHDELNHFWNEDKASKYILKILNIKKWHKVLTHNSEGEYGHSQHKQLHNLIVKLYNKNNLYVTSLRNDLKNSNNILNASEKARKISLLNTYYKSQLHRLEEINDYIVYEQIIKYTK